jgi:RimJ/RimL family protein N-acetyltransferase
MTTALTPTLETARLVLRPPEAVDFEAWAALDADRLATRYIGGRSGRTASWQGLAGAVGMWSLRGCGLFSVLERDSGRWVGRVGPWLPEGAIGTEVGWALARPAWGRGYATEAAEAAISWAFAALGWDEVIHCIDARNLASVAVAEQLGSRRLRADIDAGKPVEVYGQNRADWMAREGGLGSAR